MDPAPVSRQRRRPWAAAGGETSLSAVQGDGGVTDRLFDGAGEMGRRMAALDWGATPFGPLAEWPQCLRVALDICLRSRFPIILWCGPDLRVLYNDAYIPIFGSKHPDILGRTGYEAWGEVWDVIGPPLQAVLDRGEASWSDDGLLLLHRHGYEEEAYFTYSYSPIRDDSGAVLGVFTAVTETTSRVLGDRRLAAIRDLAAVTARAATAEEACTLACQTLAEHPADVPSVLLYLLDEATRVATLAASCGLSEEDPPARQLSLDDVASPWPLAEVVAEGSAVEFHDAGVLRRPGEARPPSALVLPVIESGRERASAVLVARLSPRRALDAAYHSFLQLVSGQVATAIAGARAYEAARARAEALTQLDRAKTIFLTNVSHEFRTPLTLLLGPLEDMVASPSIGDDDRRRAETAHRASQRLLKLVTALLDFSSLEAGRLRAAFGPADLSTLTAELASQFRSAIERGGLTLTVDCPPLREPVWVDQELWERIVLNLLSNAFKFTPEGGIRVSIREARDGPELVVADTGIGIAEADLPRLFERFYRVHASSVRSFEGTGIGLSLVHELVALHGGVVRVESAPARGATFTVALRYGNAHLPADQVVVEPIPAMAGRQVGAHLAELADWLPAGSRPEEDLLLEPGGEPVVDSSSRRGPAAPHTLGGVILVADDNADMRRYLSRLLSPHWVVEAVADGTAALTAARRRRPDLLVTDVMMPGTDGFGLLRELRSDPRTRGVPVLMLSARAGVEAEVEGIEAGADDYLVKPFSGRELVARVRTTIELARMRDREAELRGAAERAHRLESLKSEFMRLASHELRGPLTLARGYLSMIEEGALGEPPEPIRRILPILRSRLTQMNSLVDQMLETARLEEDQLQLVRTEADLRELLRRAVDMVGPMATPGHRLVVDPGEDAMTVNVDVRRIETILVNLLDNAVKYSPAGGEIRCLVTRGSADATVTISDDGLGIAAEDLSRLFSRFGRVVTPENSHISGTGLGLYLARTLARVHGGDITVRSAPGSGSAFTLTLPLSSSSSQAE